MKIEEKFTFDKKKVILKIPIYKKKFPFYFIQNSLELENYRISTSFDYLNKVWGIKINIIRDMNIPNKSKIFTDDKNNIINKNLFEKIYEGYNLEIYKFLYEKEVIFYIRKDFQNKIGETLVYFGNEFHNLRLFLEYFKGN